MNSSRSRRGFLRAATGVVAAAPFVSRLSRAEATAAQPFDPNFHEAVSQQESADVPEGQVLQQLRKGYRLRERLLRPATVVVARKPASPVDEPGQPS